MIDTRTAAKRWNSGLIDSLNLGLPGCHCHCTLVGRHVNNSDKDSAVEDEWMDERMDERHFRNVEYLEKSPCI